MKCVGYVRISQPDETIENQKLKIEEFAKGKGFVLAGIFADVDVSGSVPPRERPQYRALLEFCRVNNIKTIVFYDLSRLARSVEEGLNELKRLLEEGFNVYFAGMDFLNYDVDPMMKKKMIMDFLWFAEMYVEDIRRRTAVGMERLRREGKVYHRPTVLHYLALYFSNKNSFAELTREDIEKAKEHLRREFGYLVELKVPWYRLHKLFLERYAELYRRLPKAPRSYQAIVKVLKESIT